MSSVLPSFPTRLLPNPPLSLRPAPSLPWLPSLRRESYPEIPLTISVEAKPEEPVATETKVENKDDVSNHLYRTHTPDQSHQGSPSNLYPSDLVCQGYRQKGPPIAQGGEG